MRFFPLISVVYFFIIIKVFTEKIHHAYMQFAVFYFVKVLFGVKLAAEIMNIVNGVLQFRNSELKMKLLENSNQVQNKAKQKAAKIENFLN